MWALSFNTITGCLAVILVHSLINEHNYMLYCAAKISMSKMFPHTRSGRFSIKLWQMGRDIISIRVFERQSVALLMKNACNLSGRREKNTVILRFPLCSFHQMACDSDGSFLWWTYHMELAVIKFLWEKKGLRVQAQYLKGTGGVKETNFRPHQPCCARGADCI